jgi:hypothetical protein
VGPLYLLATNIFRPSPPLPGALSPRVKRPGPEADHSPPTSAEVKNACVYSSNPVRLHGVVLNLWSTGTTLSVTRLYRIDDTMINEYGAIDGEILLQCHFVHHKSHMTIRDRARAPAVGSREACVRPFKLLPFSVHRAYFPIYPSSRLTNLFTLIMVDIIIWWPTLSTDMLGRLIYVRRDILVPVSEHGYFVASLWRTPFRHPPKVTIDQ